MIKISIAGLSLIIALIEFSVAWIEVTHLVGVLFSTFLIIVDIMWIMYICRYKKKIKSDYHIQYAHIGIKKKRNSFE